MDLLASMTSGFVFPNELHVQWKLMIVLYPYITGIVAGAFIVSSMHHVFHVRTLQPLARMSLLFALAFLACAAVPLLVHLGQPGRALSIFLTPNPSSAMAGFGYLYAAYAILIILEVFFLYRPVAGTSDNLGREVLFQPGDRFAPLPGPRQYRHMLLSNGDYRLRVDTGCFQAWYRVGE